MVMTCGLQSKSGKVRIYYIVWGLAYLSTVVMNIRWQLVKANKATVLTSSTAHHRLEWLYQRSRLLDLAECSVLAFAYERERRKAIISTNIKFYQQNVCHRLFYHVWLWTILLAQLFFAQHWRWMSKSVIPSRSNYRHTIQFYAISSASMMLSYAFPVFVQIPVMWKPAASRSLSQSIRLLSPLAKTPITTRSIPESIGCAATSGITPSFMRSLLWPGLKAGARFLRMSIALSSCQSWRILCR